MSALFLELDKIVLFLYSPIAPHGEAAKALSVVRLATKRNLVSVGAVVGLELLATTLADKHMSTFLLNCVQVRRLQRLASLVTDITGVNPFSHVLCPTTLIPSSNYRNFLTNRLDIFRSRCQQMSTPFHVLLIADPSLEGDVADDKADPSACHQLSHASVLLYF